MRQDRPRAAAFLIAAATFAAGPPGAAGLAIQSPDDRAYAAAPPAICEPPCAHGGVCLQAQPDVSAGIGGSGGAGFFAGLWRGLRLGGSSASAPNLGSCLCPPPWSGPSCSQGGAPVDAAVAEKTSRLKRRLHELQERIRQVAEARYQTPLSGPASITATAATAPVSGALADSLRQQLFQALCSRPDSCPRGLVLGDIRVVDRSGADVRLRISSSPGLGRLSELPLGGVLAELERQLREKDGPFYVSGGRSVTAGRHEVEVWMSLDGRGVDSSVATAATRESAPEQASSRDAGVVPAPWRVKLAPSTFDALRHSAQGPVALHKNTSSPTASPSAANVEPANVQGISENSAEDLRAFRTNIVLQVVVCSVCFLFFSLMRMALPVVYQGEAADGAIPETFCGWAWVSASLTVDEIIMDAGLDRGMFVQFLNFAIRTLFAIGMPLVSILCPLHFFYGGQAAGQDKLSQFDMANVQKGSWLCWVHAAAVWYVVLTVQWSVFSQKRPFVDQRNKWLAEMPAPRSTTVFIEDIPDGRNTEEQVRKFFEEQVFGKPVVKTVFVVKDTSELEEALMKKRTIDEMLAIAKGRSQGDVVFKAIGPSEGVLMLEQADAENTVDRLRRIIDQSDDYNLNSAFVTFNSKRDAAIVMRLYTSNDHEEISVSLPPAPDDIIWADLIQKGGHQVIHAREMFGNFLVFVLFALFVPIVLWIAAIARWESLHATFGNLGFGQDPFAYAQEHYPEQVALWNGLVGTLVLTLLMSIVPTALMFIFQTFFIMKGNARLQLKVQIWYFYFLVVFVLLVTAIGSSDFGLLQTVTFLVRNPLEIFPRLAEKLPSSTHFYLEYLLVQWGVQALNITRYLNLLQYFAFRQLYDQDEAKRLSEPEDQDFYGIGSLSARATLILTIPLVFCTLSPLICFIGIVALLIARLAHSYLFVFAETRKPDLGGDFFFRQLVHTQQGLFLYVILMTGVLMERSSSWVPGAISASTILYLSNAYMRFDREFVLREMGLHEIEGQGSSAKLGIYAEGAAHAQEQLPTNHYKQPVLPAPPPPAPPQIFSVGGVADVPGWLSWLGGGGGGTSAPSPVQPSGSPSRGAQAPMQPTGSGPRGSPVSTRRFMSSPKGSSRGGFARPGPFGGRSGQDGIC